MIKVTSSAIQKLKALIVEHPEDLIVRVSVEDLDDHRIGFRITLEDSTQPDDMVHEIDGLTVAVEGQSVSRMDGITLDYNEPDGFRFHHPEPQEKFKLNLLYLK